MEKIGKEKKLLLFADDMIVYVENQRKSIKKLLELISEFSEIVRYKPKVLKSICFLYTSHKQ